MLVRNYLATTGQRQITVIISANIRSPDIAALATGQGWRGTENITLVINAGVDVATLQISGIPDDRLHIINNGRIGGVLNSGTGLYTRIRILVTNNGTIFGGGGMGGRGSSAGYSYPGGTSDTAQGGVGGNGAGFTASAAVSMVARDTSPAPTSGSYVSYSGAIFPGDTRPWAQGGFGGSGGAIGVAGANGENASSGGTGATGSVPGSPPAAAGYYVDGNSYITWLATGTRLGRVI